MMMTPSIDFDLPSLDAKGSEPAFPTIVAEPLPRQVDCRTAGLPVTTVEAFQVALAHPVSVNIELQHALENIVGQLSRTAFIAVPSTDMAAMTRQAGASTGATVVPTPVVAPSGETVPMDARAATVVPQEERVPLADVSSLRVEQSPVSGVAGAAWQAGASTGATVVPTPVVAPSGETVPMDARAATVVPQEERVSLADASSLRVEQSPVSGVAGAAWQPIAPMSAKQTNMPMPSVSDETGTGEVEDLSEAIVAAGVRPIIGESMSMVQPEMAAKSDVITAVDSVKAAFAPVEVLPTETFFEVANAVADTLLVSPGLLRGEGEVRVQLRPDVLEGSEIRIAVTGRQLAVDFIPQTQDVAVLIEQNRPQLEQHLAARIQTFTLSVGVHRRRSFETRGSAT